MALPSPAEGHVQTEHRAPDGPTERALTEIWQDVLKRRPIGVRDNFFDLGGHSLLAVAILSELKIRLGAEVPLMQILERPTIEALAAFLDRSSLPEAATGDGSCQPNALIVLKAGGPRCFFLVHDGDGETLLYRNLARRMPEDFAIYGIPPRRLLGIPMAATDVSAMAAAYVAEVRARQPHGPYYLGGLCAGGVIAFEMASQLERRGEAVELVALMDAVEPTTRPRPWLTSRRRWQRLQAIFRGPPTQRERLATMARSRVWKAIGQALRSARNAARYELSSRCEGAWVRLRFHLLAQIMAHGWTWPKRLPSLTVRQIYLAAKQSYVPGVLRVGHVVLMKASQGADADEPAMDQFDDPLLGWGRFVVGHLETVEMPGGHSSMLQEPNVEILAGRLNRYLETRPAP